MFRPTALKLGVSVTIVLMVIASFPMIGLTVSEKDDSEGVMIDFGFYDVKWIPLSLGDRNCIEDLSEACHINGNSFSTDSDNETVLQINEQHSLPDRPWTLFTMDTDKSRWAAAEKNPSETKASDYRLTCWARTDSSSDVMPGTDHSGGTYYRYATGGISKQTGNPMKVVSLAPSLTEIVASVGGVEYLVGVDRYSDCPDSVTERKEDGSLIEIGGYIDPNYEWIVRLQPDLVFCDGGAGQHISMADRLIKSGIDCVVLYDSKSIESVYRNIWIVAASMGLEENAGSVIEKIEMTVSNVRAKIGNTAERSVFVALSPIPTPWTSGRDTFMNDIIETVTASNIFAPQDSSWFMVSKEWINNKRPQCMIIINERAEATMDAYLEMLDSLDPMWKDTPAFRDGNVYMLTGKTADIFSRPGPRIGEAAELLGKIIHGTQFTLDDPLDSVPKYLGDDYQKYLKHQGGDVFA